LSELRLATERERSELQSQLSARDEEIATLRSASTREHEAFETRRAELRSAFDRISQLRVQTESGPTAPDSRAETQHGSPPAQPHELDPATGEASAVVPKGTLRQARAQFEFLAKECVRRGDVATQAMCELGAHTMDLALAADERSPPLPVREVARSILRPGSASAGIGN
jgi:hypothetical protein